MTEHSEYTQGYITACDETLKKYDAPNWFVNFFESYRKGLKNSSTDKSNGNRNFLTNAFADALNNLLPPNGFELVTSRKGLEEKFSRETPFKEFIEPKGNTTAKESIEFYEFLTRKRIDFLLKNENGQILIIEFKNTASFDSISSAATEMKLFRDHLKENFKNKVTTWTISMFCGQSPDSLNLLNDYLGKNDPLGKSIDKIWTFRKWDSDKRFETPFDVKNFIALRTALLEFSKK